MRFSSRIKGVDLYIHHHPQGAHAPSDMKVQMIPSSWRWNDDQVIFKGRRTIDEELCKVRELRREEH